MAYLGEDIPKLGFGLMRLPLTGDDPFSPVDMDELKAMVDGIRKVDLAMGSFEKQPSEAELRNRNVARKSIVAKRHIACGEELTEENITTKRPGNGIDPMMWPEVLGTKAIRDFEEDELIEI